VAEQLYRRTTGGLVDHPGRGTESQIADQQGDTR